MRKVSIVLALFLISVTTFAQQQPNPCAQAEAHQFDFWIGEWDVYKNGTDTIIGHNIIRPVASGCALFENWNSADNSSIGSSINKYNFSKGMWQQMWVDNGGTSLLIEGEYKDSKMILENEQTTRDGKGKVKNRITWFNNKDGTVRQFWQFSTDNGKTWSIAFDGLYKKVKS